MKRFILFIGLSILLTILISSCTQNIINYPEQQYETMIQYVATLYNKGYNYSKDSVINFMKNSNYLYPQKILGYYKYFSNLGPYPEFKEISTTDKASLDAYVKNFKFDYWTKDATVFSKISYDPSTYPGYDNLVSKVHNILTNTGSKFWDDVPELYPNMTTKKASELARYIVDSAIKISYSGLYFSRCCNGTFFEKTVKIDKYFIRPEILLAFFMTESSFEPFAYKPEVNSDGKIYSVSFGLGQTLLDINLINDKVELTNIAAPGDYTFTLLNRNYFSNSYKAKNLFQVQTSELFTATFLQLLFDRIVKEGWIE